MMPRRIFFLRMHERAPWESRNVYNRDKSSSSAGSFEPVRQLENQFKWYLQSFMVGVLQHGTTVLLDNNNTFTITLIIILLFIYFLFIYSNQYE
ncbi:hypothetical protein QL285_000045 [Trifolium repens]|nr:hypothetical protein QL285_000045 [Trifolium repens]